jgi:hypothetical protein
MMRIVYQEDVQGRSVITRRVVPDPVPEEMMKAAVRQALTKPSPSSPRNGMISCRGL